MPPRPPPPNYCSTLRPRKCAPSAPATTSGDCGSTRPPSSPAAITATEAAGSPRCVSRKKSPLCRRPCGAFSQCWYLGLLSPSRRSTRPRGCRLSGSGQTRPARTTSPDCPRPALAPHRPIPRVGPPKRPMAMQWCSCTRPLPARGHRSRRGFHRRRARPGARRHDRGSNGLHRLTKNARASANAARENPPRSGKMELAAPFRRASASCE